MTNRVLGRALSYLAVSAAAVALGASLAAQAAPPGTTARPAAPKAQDAAVALPSARTIIDRHIEATGGRKAILAHTSTRAVGTIAMPAGGLSGDIEMLAAKPNLMLVRVTIGGIGEVVEGFDGTIAWSVSPMTGPMLAQGKELEQKKFDADFYGELRETGRYSAMETVEKTTFDGRPCYKVKLVRAEGGEDFDYYDVATGLRAGSTGTRETPMGTISATQVQTDYKKFGDLLIPTTVKQSVMGMEQVITLTSVEHDKVSPSAFEPPAAVKALIK